MNTKYILSALAFLPLTLFSQTVTIGNGAEVKVEGQADPGVDAEFTVDGDLTIEDGGKLTAVNDARFFVSGDIHYEDDAPFVYGTSIFTLNGTAAQQITNTTTTNNFPFYSLVLNNSTGFTINTTSDANVEVYDILDVQSGQLTTNDNLTIEATSPTSYGRVAYSPVVNPIVGKTTVKKTLSNTNGAWRQLSMPLEGRWEDGNWSGITFNFSDHLPANEINTYSWKSSGPGGIADGWLPAAGTATSGTPLSIFNAGGSAKVDISQTISCKGELRDNIASFGVSLNFTRDPADLSGTDPAAIGWNYIPNPWASLIDVQTWLTSASFDAFGPAYKAVHVYNSVTGQYQAILLNNTVTKINWNTDGSDIDDADANIPPFQAVWVKADAAGQVVTLYKNEMQTTDFKNQANEQFMKQKPELFRLNVFDSDSLWDQIVVFFNRDATRGFDNVGDAYHLKSPNENVPSFYGLEGNSAASIIGRPATISDSVEISYASTKNQSRFHIMPDLSELGGGWHIYLKDRATSEFYKLEDDESLAFEHSASGTQNRFVLFYSKNPNDYDAYVSQESPTIQSFVRNEELLLKSVNYSGSAEVVISDAMGRTLYADLMTVQEGEEYRISIPKKNQLVVVSVRLNGNYISKKMFY